MQTQSREARTPRVAREPVLDALIGLALRTAQNSQQHTVRDRTTPRKQRIKTHAKRDIAHRRAAQQATHAMTRDKPHVRTQNSFSTRHSRSSGSIGTRAYPADDLNVVIHLRRCKNHSNAMQSRHEISTACTLEAKHTEQTGSCEKQRRQPERTDH